MCMSTEQDATSAPAAENSKPRRRFQFRLRTLLILVTLCALPLAWVAQQRELRRDEQAATAWVLDRKGEVYDQWNPILLGGSLDDEWNLFYDDPGENWWRDLQARWLGPRVRSFELANQVNQDSSLLAAFNQARWITLWDCQMPELSFLATMDDLRILLLHSTAVEDRSAISDRTSLQVLMIDDSFGKGDCPFDELPLLANLTDLEVLVLDNLTARDLSPLADLKKLRVLHLERVAVDDISPLTELPNLEDLELRKLSTADLSPLQKLTQLKRLTISMGTAVPPNNETHNEQRFEEQLKQLRQALPNCDIRHVGY